MSKLIKIREAEDSSYFVEVKSRNYGRKVHLDGYRESDPEKDELTQILSFIVDHDWETASTSETCFMLLREKNKISIKLDEELSLVINNDNAWSSVDLYAKIESKPIKCDLTFDSVKSTVDQSLSLLDKTSDKYATYFTFA